MFPVHNYAVHNDDIEVYGLKFMIRGDGTKFYFILWTYKSNMGRNPEVKQNSHHVAGQSTA
jgi:hypothetical protein